MHQMYNFGANLKPVIKQNIVKLKKNLQKIWLLHSAMFDSASPDLQFSGENDYIAFDEYYNEPIGRSFGNCEIPFVTS